MLQLIAIALASTAADMAVVPAFDERHRLSESSCVDTCFGQTCDYWIKKCAPLALFT